MKHLVTVVVVMSALAVVGGADGARAVASGDTCTASGAGVGMGYTLSISIPSAPQQWGFAIGGSGVTVTNIEIPGSTGAFASASGPGGTNATWTGVAPLTPGTVVANVTTTSEAKEPLLVYPQGAQSAYLDPIRCAITHKTPAAAPTASVVFVVARHVLYDA